MRAVVLHEYGGPENLKSEDNLPGPQTSGSTVLTGEPRALDPKSCYACWMMTPAQDRDCKGELRGLGAARGSNPNSTDSALGACIPAHWPPVLAVV
jgi:hypothetical protein